MWIRFTKDMSWKPTDQMTRIYKAGQRKNVTRACAQKALNLGAGEKVSAPRRSER